MITAERYPKIDQIFTKVTIFKEGQGLLYTFVNTFIYRNISDSFTL